MSQVSRILRWSHWHAGAMLLSLVALAAGLPLWFPVALAAASLGAYLLVVVSIPDGRRWRIGLANHITLSRFLLVSLATVWWNNLPLAAGSILLVLALCLDGIDGHVARRLNEADIVGHYLDIEIDAVIVLLMSVLLWRYAGLSPLILLIGALRYLYVLFLLAFVANQRLEPKRRYASYSAVVLYLAMALRLALDHSLVSMLLITTSGLLVLSFARSLWFQIQGDSAAGQL